jgi:hypothetical protein
MKVEFAFIRGVLWSYVTSCFCVFAALVAFTRNPRMAAISVWVIINIVILMMALLIENGLKLGAIEAISLQIIVGLAVDFLLHLAHAYTKSEFYSPFGRTRFSFLSIGAPVVSGATTTMISSFCLCWAQTQLLATVGEIIFFMTFVSIILSSLYFIPILMVCGPKGPKQVAKYGIDTDQTISLNPENTDEVMDTVRTFGRRTPGKAGFSQSVATPTRSVTRSVAKSTGKAPPSSSNQPRSRGFFPSSATKSTSKLINSRPAAAIPDETEEEDGADTISTFTFPLSNTATMDPAENLTDDHFPEIGGGHRDDQEEQANEPEPEAEPAQATSVTEQVPEAVMENPQSPAAGDDHEDRPPSPDVAVVAEDPEGEEDHEVDVEDEASHGSDTPVTNVIVDTGID